MGGAWVLAGLVTGTASVALVWGVLYALIRSAVYVIGNALS